MKRSEKKTIEIVLKSKKLQQSKQAGVENANSCACYGRAEASRLLFSLPLSYCTAGILCLQGQVGRMENSPMILLCAIRMFRLAFSYLESCWLLPVAIVIMLGWCHLAFTWPRVQLRHKPVTSLRNATYSMRFLQYDFVTCLADTNTSNRLVRRGGTAWFCLVLARIIAVSIVCISALGLGN